MSTIKIGSSVRVVGRCSGLTADGAIDLNENDRGIFLSEDDGVARIALRDGGKHVFIKVQSIAATRGRPVKASTLASLLEGSSPRSLKVATPVETPEQNQDATDALTHVSSLVAAQDEMNDQVHSDDEDFSDNLSVEDSESNFLDAVGE